MQPAAGERPRYLPPGHASVNGAQVAFEMAGPLDALGIERAGLIGRSFGGRVAIAHPEIATALPKDLPAFVRNHAGETDPSLRSG